MFSLEKEIQALPCFSLLVYINILFVLIIRAEKEELIKY